MKVVMKRFRCDNAEPRRMKNKKREEKCRGEASQLCTEPGEGSSLEAKIVSKYSVFSLLYFRALVHFLLLGLRSDNLARTKGG